MRKPKPPEERPSRTTLVGDVIQFRLAWVDLKRQMWVGSRLLQKVFPQPSFEDQRRRLQGLINEMDSDAIARDWE